MELTIVTNNVPRNLIYGSDLTKKERADFAYIPEEDFDCHDFFRYRGRVYDLSEMMRTPEGCQFAGWHGYTSDTYFSGVLVKYAPDTDYEQIIVGSYYS